MQQDFWVSCEMVGVVVLLLCLPLRTLGLSSLLPKKAAHGDIRGDLKRSRVCVCTWWTHCTTGARGQGVEALLSHPQGPR